MRCPAFHCAGRCRRCAEVAATARAGFRFAHGLTSIVRAGAHRHVLAARPQYSTACPAATASFSRLMQVAAPRGLTSAPERSRRWDVRRSSARSLRSCWALGSSGRRGVRGGGRGNGTVRPEMVKALVSHCQSA